MFRFTIREILFLTVSAALATGWWLEHRAHAEAAEDARMLAHFSVSERMCGNEASWFMQLQRKYGAERIDWEEVLSQPDEAKEGIELEP